MLLGTYHVKVASGRRVFVPSLFRTELGENFILAKWYENCLVAVAIERWQALYKRLTGSKKIIVLPIRDTERFILGSAYRVELDEQGRIVIPENLIDFAALGEEISFVGLGDRIEIWDKKIWEEKQKNLSKEAAGLIERLSKDEEK